jgi:uroporphyrinogen-III synthase
MTPEPIHILSTKLLPEQLIKDASAQGFVVDAFSFISTEPVADKDLGRNIRDLGLKPLVAVFTSVNAVEAVKRWLDAPPAWRIFCIGSATRRSVGEYFGKGAIAGTAGSAETLAATISRWDIASTAAGDLGREIFFFCGDHRREELPFRLHRDGFHVNEWIVYRTILTPQKTERVYDGIVFFSPTGVESFFSVNTVDKKTRLFAIGETTAAAISVWCVNPVVTSGTPEKGALIQQMMEHFQSKKNKED